MAKRPPFLKFFILFLAISGTMLLGESKQKPLKMSQKQTHLYLLIGQSNMAGRAPIAEEEKSLIKNCYLLNGEDEWENASNPLNRYSTIRKGIGMQKLGPGYTFSKAMLNDDKSISLGLIVNAKGGSKIDQWAKGTKFYKEAIRRTLIAMESGTLKGILWHQGESNAKDEQYLEKLKALVENLRTDLNAPNLPFVAGQVNNVPLVNEQIAQLPTVLENTAFVKSEGLKAYDRWHFNSESVKELGNRYAHKMINLLKTSK